MRLLWTILQQLLASVLIIFAINGLFKLFSATHFSTIVFIYSLIGCAFSFSLKRRDENGLPLKIYHNYSYKVESGQFASLDGRVHPLNVRHKPGISKPLTMFLIFVSLPFVLDYHFPTTGAGSQGWKWLTSNCFWLFLILVLGILQKVLRRETIVNSMNWKKLHEGWIKSSGIQAFTAGGLTFIGQNQAVADSLHLKITRTAHLHMYVSIYLISILLLFFAIVLSNVGRSISKSDDSNIPFSLFFPSFILAWLYNCGVYTLLGTQIILSLHAHLVN